jgi:lipopolysaccharide biosynthesis protein
LPEAAAKAISQADSPLNIICLHLFHLDLWDEFKMALRPLIGPKTPLYISLPEEHAHFVSVIRRDFGTQECETFVVENRGLDVLPFLRQFRFLMDHRLRPLTMTKLHSKKSAHVAREAGDSWRRDLYQALLARHAVVVDQFNQNPRLGMVCSGKWWLAEGAESQNFQAESRVIAEAQETFDVGRSSHYLSGSMYTVSFAYLERLFADVDLEAYFSSFPSGYQPSDTPAHAFERIICYGLQRHDYRVCLL